MNGQENSRFLGINDLLIVMFLTQVAIFLPEYMHLFNFKCRVDRKLVLIGINILTSENNEIREGSKYLRLYA